MINLDARRTQRAAKREAQYADGIPVTHAGRTYKLPAELPVAVLDPLLDGDVDLAGLVTVAVNAMRSTGGDQQEQIAALVAEALMTHPDLPGNVLRGVRQVLANLFGPNQWAAFMGSNPAPSLPDLAALIGGLVNAYGVGLGEAFGSADSSPSGGKTSSPTFNGSAVSTPVVSGEPLASTGS